MMTDGYIPEKPKVTITDAMVDRAVVLVLEHAGETRESVGDAVYLALAVTQRACLEVALNGG